MKRQDKYPETKWFHYNNANPKNRLTEDCYVRATCVATTLPYDYVVEHLVQESLKSGYAIASKNNIVAFFKRLHIPMEKQPKNGSRKLTGKQFCEMFPKGRYVCFIGGHHITAIVDGKINDTWDCSEKTIGNYFNITPMFDDTIDSDIPY